MNDIDEFVDSLRASLDPKCHTAADFIVTLWADREFFLKEIADCKQRLALLENSQITLTLPN